MDPKHVDGPLGLDAPASFSAGVTTSYRAADSFTAVVVSASGVVAEARVEATNVTFTSLGEAQALGSDGTARITAGYSSNLVTVVINGKGFPRTITAPPRLGFFVWDPRIRFGDVTFRCAHGHGGRAAAERSHVRFVGERARGVGEREDRETSGSRMDGHAAEHWPASAERATVPRCS